MYQSVETQTERIRTEFIKIESYHKLKFTRYYFDTKTQTIFSIRAGKNEVIRKQIKPTQTGNKTIVILRDTEGKPRTLNYTTLIEFLKSEYC